MMDGSPPSTRSATAILRLADIASRLADLAVEDIRVRYDLGCALNAIRSELATAASTRVLRAAIHTFRLSPSVLRRYARVSGTISQAELEYMLALRGPHGAALTWSHLELVAGVRSRQARRTLATELVANALSVRATAEKLRPYSLGRVCTAADRRPFDDEDTVAP